MRFSHYGLRAALAVSIVLQAEAQTTTTPSPAPPATSPSVTEATFFDLPDGVSCGGHFAEDCRVCSSGNSWAWCNGDCAWYGGDCVRKTWKVQAYFGLQALVALWISFVPLLAFSYLGMLVYASAYRAKVVSRYPLEIRDQLPGDEEEEVQQLREEEFGLDAAWTEPNVCLWAFLCTPVLVAKNYHVGQVLDFWPSCLAMGLAMAPPLCCCGVPGCIRGVLSGRLRHNMRLAPGDAARDCILGTCCLPCDVGRESMEIDRVEHMAFDCPLEVNSVWVEPPHVREQERQRQQKRCRSCMDGPSQPFSTLQEKAMLLVSKLSWQG